MDATQTKFHRKIVSYRKLLPPNFIVGQKSQRGPLELNILKWLIGSIYILKRLFDEKSFSKRLHIFLLKKPLI
jgi:hypothetical protein